MFMKRVFALSFFFPVFSASIAQTHFTDVTEQAGIHHAFKVFEGMFGGGACVIDYNKDGFEDLYITGGMNDDILYKNNGNGTFTNVFEGSGLEFTRDYVTQGVAGADVNKDGFVDLLVTTITTRKIKQEIPRAINLLFLNNGNETFKDATKEFGLDDMYSFSTGVSFGDVNEDGWPDVYIGNYFKEFRGKLSVINDATVVGANQIAEGYFLINEEGKRFRDAFKEYGLDFRGFGFGGVFTDFNNDGHQDLFINHDFGYKRTPDLLLRNDFPDSHFTDVAKTDSMDLKINSMSTAVGDYNNDGWMDYFVTNIGFNYFMVNQGRDKPFVNKARDYHMDIFTISWGVNFADFDNDGDVDLFVANGDLNPNCVPMGDFYFENEGSTFIEKSRSVGVADYGIGRGSVAFDYDNDGDLDLLVVNQVPQLTYPLPSVTRLYRNDSAQGNWVKIALQGVSAESHGLGSRIEVVAGKLRMIREIDGGSSSHLSQNSVIAHFGLGEATVIDSVIVNWTGGERQVVTNQPVNKMISIRQNPVEKKSSNVSWVWALVFTIFALGGLLFFSSLRRQKK